ncbi:LutC/YkgG family protein [Pseudarthrobacter sp. YS3]|jgi:L-lactate dehydrogenase complex protein LldG|uniref:Lactate utilization protein C n=1 Tax=Pseudarthrobacter humi TaxID=2952523 RepID=A0ABT1LXQ5_9MICC|nr:MULTISPECIES: lactate utilization protein C [Micrococcaceae]MCP9001946.1 lactate utilization protein C [Pseudarthrobacter humi]MDP9989427.1 L-lactate dehydrogenase complex protein LldG [Arthrobacter oryzae]MEA3551043.1 lactate utilization protein C [Pseudarthrobacter sp. C1]MUU69777.1 lactate utilization protein C [Pseudarthrobacter sp. GA104]UKA71353.1 lactate utilization protein C [Arthrobacter sp. FW306-06-A]
MSAREEILERIRTALKDSPVAPEIPREYRAASQLDEEALIELLVDRLIDYKAQVSVVDNAEVPARIAELLADAGSYVVPTGLDAGWLTGLELEHDSRRRQDSAAAPLSVAELDGIDAVVTGSAVAVAETGTIILDGSPNQGRRAITLVPDHHICIVKTTDITGILPEALRRIDGTRPLTMISGPSATSDIELERVEGVHGPRKLDVIIAR